MEKELKELERRVSRLENVTGNTYDFYCSNQYLMLPIELLKLGVFNYAGINTKRERAKARSFFKKINYLKKHNKTNNYEKYKGKIKRNKKTG